MTLPRARSAGLLTALVLALLLTGSSAAPQRLAAGGDRFPRIGIAYGETLTWASAEGLDRALDDAVALHAGWIRVDLAWNTVQPSRTEFRWRGFDRIVSAANKRGLEVLPIVTYTPAWARRTGCSVFTCPPRDPRLFAQFAARASARYSPRGVHTWEIWNEQNVPAFWVSPDPVAYARLVTLASRAIKRHDADARVAMGGMAATDTVGGAIDPRRFLRGVCERGACSHVDAIGYHPYTFPYLPGDPGAAATAWKRIASTRPSLVSVLRRFGVGEKRIWLTEYGAPTGGPGSVVDDAAAVTPATDHVTMRLQARIADDALRTAFVTRNVSALFWYTDRDTGGRSSNVDFYGLRRADGTRKPAWHLFAERAWRVSRP